MIRQLEEELREYDQLKSGELELPDPHCEGVSQTKLARRLGVSKQVISRYEEADYQAVGIGRLQEILDAIGIKTVVTLSA
jgi:hypothetical protein